MLITSYVEDSNCRNKEETISNLKASDYLMKKRKDITKEWEE